MKRSSDIESVWNSLKCMSLQDDMLNSAPFRKKKNKSKSKTKRCSKLTERSGLEEGLMENFSEQLPTQIFTAKESSDAQCKGVDEVTTEPSILPLLNDENWNYNVTQFDSDDEKDFCFKESDRNNTSSCRPWTMNLFVSAMQSESLSEKIKALTSLKSTIESLDLSEPPIIDLPPPLDASRIALTHRQGSIISDMPGGNFAPQWAAWEHTYSSVMKQFTPSEVKTGATELPLPTSKEIQTLLEVCGIPLFRIFNDRSEKCRQLALQCTILMCLHAADMGKHLPFLMSAIQARYPESYLDEELNIFIGDADLHDRYKRGSAEEREDRTFLLSSGSTVNVIENSEECRLLLCKVLSSIIRGHLFRGTISVVSPYFSDFIFSLQRCIRDPFPEVKIESCHILVQILRIPQWETGAKVFAKALAAGTLGNMRHRSPKVRIAAIELFEASVSLPDRAKLKGAGTEAILDLVGFREENVLSVAAFYDTACGISINILAELVQDKNPSVRARCCSMIAYFMVCLPDRNDYHQRLLPYLLSFFRDSKQSTRQIALQAIEACGQQYEAENSNCVIERRQYGVDGDNRCNYDAPPPFPFEKRPRIGARLFVRSNTKRFFDALLKELTNWRSATKLRSVELLEILIVYCEEHLTMDISHTLSLLVQGLRFAVDDDDERIGKEMKEKILNCIEVIGRYVNPEAYIAIILPRVAGDINKSATSFAEGGVQSDSSKAVHAASLSALVKGSQIKELIPHLCSLITSLSSLPLHRKLSSPAVIKECINTVVVLLERVLDDTQMLPLKILLLKSERANELLKALDTFSSCLALHDLSESRDSSLISIVRRGQAAVKNIKLFAKKL